MRLGLLVSGGLGLKFLFFINNNFTIEFVMTDYKSDGIINYCKVNDIPCYTGNPRTNLAQNFYEKQVIDILVSINYLFIINLPLINLPKLLAFNIHGSLLPKYRGRTPHVWAIINNEQKTGVTAHVIDEGCDTGDIIYQIEVPILDSDTGSELLKKFEPIYETIVSNVLDLVRTNTLVSIPQVTSNATFFGKRVPEDGQINWNWQKERIRNWVRAQAYPYPGAFTISENDKIIIDEICIVNHGFEYSMPNGLVLSESPSLVKTPNGVVELKSIRINSDKLKSGTVLK